MIFRALNEDGDWTFGKGKQSFLKDNAAIGLNIRTRLLSFLNDCFFDINAGLDWFNYLGRPGKENDLKLRARAVILQSYGVVRISSIDVTTSRTDRSTSMTFSVDTIFSTNYKDQIEVVNYA